MANSLLSIVGLSWEKTAGLKLWQFLWSQVLHHLLYEMHIDVWYDAGMGRQTAIHWAFFCLSSLRSTRRIIYWAVFILTSPCSQAIFLLYPHYIQLFRKAQALFRKILHLLFLIFDESFCSGISVKNLAVVCLRFLKFMERKESKIPSASAEGIIHWAFFVYRLTPRS